jgi:hypothetical protein
VAEDQSAYRRDPLLLAEDVELDRKGVDAILDRVLLLPVPALLDEPYMEKAEGDEVGGSQSCWEGENAPPDHGVDSEGGPKGVRLWIDRAFGELVESIDMPARADWVRSSRSSKVEGRRDMLDDDAYGLAVCAGDRKVELNEDVSGPIDASRAARVG